MNFPAKDEEKALIPEWWTRDFVCQRYHSWASWKLLVLSYVHILITMSLCRPNADKFRLLKQNFHQAHLPWINIGNGWHICLCMWRVLVWVWSEKLVYEFELISDTNNSTNSFKKVLEMLKYVSRRYKKIVILLWKVFLPQLSGIRSEVVMMGFIDFSDEYGDFVLFTPWTKYFLPRGKIYIQSFGTDKTSMKIICLNIHEVFDKFPAQL